MSMTMLRKRDRSEEEARIGAMEAFVRSMTRFPIQSLALLRASAQISPYLEETRDWLLNNPDEKAGGKPYLSVVPLLQGSRDTTWRYYLTRYESVLKPLFKPQLRRTSPQLDGPRMREQQKIIDRLYRFPVLTPSLLQAALSISAYTWREDIKTLIDEPLRLVTVWHPDVLEASPTTKDGEKVPNLGDWTERKIHEDVTYRGVRYFLTGYAERLRVFLLREEDLDRSMKEEGFLRR